MRYNIFVNLLFALFLALFATSCIHKAGIDEPAGRCISVAPTSDGTMLVQLICNSDVRSYIGLVGIVTDRAGIRSRVDFAGRDTVNFLWSPLTGPVKIAFKATQLQNTVTNAVLKRDEGVTFDVQAIVRTPDDGIKVNWGGLEGTSVGSSSEFWKHTVNAVNKGVPGETPGTGTTRFLNLNVQAGAAGEYCIQASWKAGNLFEEKTII